MQTLATTYRNLSLLAVGADLDAAIEWGSQALSIQKRLAESEPSNLEFKADLATCYSSLATLYSKLPAENTPRLIRAYDAAAKVQQELVLRQPFRIDRRHELAITLNNRGLAQTRQSLATDAERSFREAIELQQGLVKQLPGDLSVSSQLGGMHNNLGMVYQLQKNHALAADAYRAGIRLQQYAYQNAPHVNRFREHLSRTYFNYGRTLRRMNKPRRAATVALHRRKLWPHDPTQLFSVAEELAVASRDLQSIEDKQATRYKTETLNTIKLAVAQGWKPQLEIRDTPVWDLLQSEPEFRGLMTKLQFSSSNESDLEVTRDQS